MEELKTMAQTLTGAVESLNTNAIQDLKKNSENFKQQSLLNFQELTVGKDTIPIASCSGNDNPYVLSRCSPKIYDNKSNVVSNNTNTNTTEQKQTNDIEPYEFSEFAPIHEE